MRALVCDWCARVTTTLDGWYELQPTGDVQHPVFDHSPRTFCGLDCLGDYVDDARTSPTGHVMGAAPMPTEVALPAAEREPGSSEHPPAEPEVPAVEPEREETGRRPVSIVALAAALAADRALEGDIELEAEAASLEQDPPLPETPAPLRGLGRGLGRTGS
jgi:hypothetical protein